jgi:hypothetical protein
MKEIWVTNINNYKGSIIENWWSFYLAPYFIFKIVIETYSSQKLFAIILCMIALLCSCISTALSMRIVKKVYQSQTAKMA